jgi:hypothetical protein
MPPRRNIVSRLSTGSSSASRKQAGMDSDMRQDHLWSRRGVVKGAAGAAAVGAVTLASPHTAQAGTTSAGDRPGRAGRAGRAGTAASAAVPNQADRPAGEETIVVHVRDARTGQLDIFVGERHIQVRDRDLASRLIAVIEAR